MDKNKYEIVRLRMERTAEALRKNNFFAVCADNCDEAVEIIENLITEGSTVAVGGSMTLSEAGVLDLLRSGRYEFYDRYEPGLTSDQINFIHKKAFSCDAYLCSSNAVTENGELYNIDGNGNRIAAMIYGPESVIVVAGYNKIVSDVNEAHKRIKEFAAPANAMRLSCNTPCAITGKCCDCHSDSRICSTSVLLGYQQKKDRIKVILVGEELGY